MKSTDRIQELDILRGFALCGVFVVNLSYRLTAPASSFEQAISRTVEYVFQDRFWPLFSLLFGVGFTLLLRRVETRGDRIGTVYLRRMGVLFVFGVLYAALLEGSVLLARYAVLGVRPSGTKRRKVYVKHGEGTRSRAGRRLRTQRHHGASDTLISRRVSAQQSPLPGQARAAD